MSSLSQSLFALQCSIAIALAGCGGPDGGQSCQHDSDCASNFCEADGTCAPVGDGGMPVVDAPAGSNIDASTGACTPNHDGKIEANELPLVAGAMANFRVATNVAVDTAGSAGSGNTRTWDLSGELSGDMDVAVTLASPSGAYWASKFPTATYATPLEAGSDLLGVFAVTATAVELVGVVSPTSGGGTELSYSPPALILQVPFGAGSAWTSTSTVTGTADDVLVDYSETYTSNVDEVGTMTTPYGTFPVLRVATDFSQSEGIETLDTSRTFAWVAECFGTVATIRSEPDESGSEFGSAAEVRRLAP